jgi:hypothetical protein
MADLEVDSKLSGTVGSSVSGSLSSEISGSMDSNVTLSGIPDAYSIKIPEIDKVEFGVDPLHGTVKIEPVQIQLAPVTTNIAIKEIPSQRVHLPLNYSLGLSVFGVELAALRLCGEGMVINEPYEPGPCEACGHGREALTDHRKTGQPARPDRG